MPPFCLPCRSCQRQLRPVEGFISRNAARIFVVWVGMGHAKNSLIHSSCELFGCPDKLHLSCKTQKYLRGKSHDRLAVAFTQQSTWYMIDGLQISMEWKIIAFLLQISSVTTLLMYLLVSSKYCAMSSWASSKMLTTLYLNRRRWKQGTIGEAFNMCVTPSRWSAWRFLAAPIEPASGLL